MDLFKLRQTLSWTNYWLASIAIGIWFGVIALLSRP